MTNPTLERAARAAFTGGTEFFAEGDGWQDLSEITRETYRDSARAVLMAVRAEMCDTMCIGVIDDILSGSRE